MSKKLLSLVLVGLLLNVIGVIPAYASSKEETRARFAKRVKEGISRLGTGPEARVEVRLLDGRKLKGYISEAGENSFVIVDTKSGAASTVPYPQVKQVTGNNLSKGAKIAITVGLVVGLLFLLTVVIGRT
jgi:hypothetical protein